MLSLSDPPAIQSRPAPPARLGEGSLHFQGCPEVILNFKESVFRHLEALILESEETDRQYMLPVSRLCRTQVEIFIPRAHVFKRSGYSIASNADLRAL